ncbi:MAG: hypothetical protein ACRECH_07470 [Nitrososphaerales archaeon]
MSKKSSSRTMLLILVLGIIIAGSVIGIFAYQITSGKPTTGSSSSSSKSKSTSITSTATTSTTSSSSSFTEMPATFYVATDGNDSWSGTLSSPNSQNTDGPFATLAQAQISVRNLKNGNPTRSTPIVVEIEAGTYYLGNTLDFTSADSGTQNAQIIWEAALGANVSISGGKQVKNWTLVSSNEWSASASGLQYFEQLWRNAQRIYRPRTTMNSYLYIASTVYSNYQEPRLLRPSGVDV